MSGTEPKPAPVVFKDQVLFTLGNFDVVRAEFYTQETDTVEKGYAVVWQEDGVTQILTNNVAGALNFAGQAAQTLQMARALIEQEKEAASTEGLLGGVIPDDAVLN